MKASGLARPGGGRPLGRASSCPEASREPAVSANTGPSRPLEALRRRLGALRAVRGRPRPSLCGGSPFRTCRTCPTNRPDRTTWATGGERVGGKISARSPRRGRGRGLGPASAGASAAAGLRDPATAPAPHLARPPGRRRRFAPRTPRQAAAPPRLLSSTSFATARGGRAPAGAPGRASAAPGAPPRPDRSGRLRAPRGPSFALH